MRCVRGGVLGCIVGVFVASVAAAPHNWAAALQRAKTERKFVLAYFADPDCFTCQRYRAETLDNPQLAALLRRFVVVSLPMPQSAGQLRKLVPGWQEVLPVVVFTDAKGTPQDYIVGHLNATTFAAALRAFLRGQRSDAVERRLQRRPHDLATLYEAAVWFLERGDGARGLPLAEKVLAKDPDNRKGYHAPMLVHRGLFYTMHRARIAHRALDDFRAVVTRFPQAPVADEARFYLAVTHLALGQDAEARRWLVAVLRVSKSPTLRAQAQKLLRFLDAEPPADLRRGDGP
ncbi:Thiol:disulfide interchange protein DsbD [bacterium HR17]|uniref:Thiol:disulfide interchange protein DsbD n=1 Tax=Candidatus Fervidibacter japonicus TaxID=2035412 RepID=A0A2H5XE13_9BACT|nr:Thiol:disulfide interchange protein DsbD [bacterium HR17]